MTLEDEVIRYNQEEIEELQKLNISVELAHSYCEHLSISSINDLIQSEIPPEVANEYDWRLNGQEIINYIKQGIPPAIYYYRFFKKDIITFIKANIPPEIANAYYNGPLISADNIIEFIRASIPPNIIKSYGYNFFGNTLLELIESKVPPDIAKAYDKRFANNIVKLMQASVSPETANKYHKMFSCDEVIHLVKENIASSVAEKYHERFKAYNISKLLQNKISFEKANQYANRFESWDIVELIKADISNESAILYHELLNGKNITKLVQANIVPERANRVHLYNRRFRPFLADLIIANIPSTTAEAYSKRFSIIKDIILLHKSNISPEEADSYDERFDAKNIIELVKSNISPEEADSYDDRLSGWLINMLKQDNANAEKAQKFLNRLNVAQLGELYDCRRHIKGEYICLYNERFTGADIVPLIFAEVPPEEADKYNSKLDGDSIAVLFHLGLTPDKISPKQMNSLSGLFEKVVQYLHNIRNNRFTFINLGTNSLILFYNNNAWKFSTDINKEVRLLNKLKNPNHIIQVQSDTKKSYGLMDKSIEPTLSLAVELQYIDGKNLEELLKENPLRNPDKIIKYCSHIFRGLEELKAANIYHRDIRPANIMIEEKEDKAIIIDLGIATDDPNAMPKDNRRYGGTDIMSLGQIVYKMATGNNLFNEHINEETYNQSIQWADEIEQLRNEFCENKETRVHYLKKVEQNIEDKRLRSIIRTCLRAGYKEQQNKTSEEIRDKVYEKVRNVCFKNIYKGPLNKF